MQAREALPPEDEEHRPTGNVRAWEKIEKKRAADRGVRPTIKNSDPSLK